MKFGCKIDFCCMKNVVFKTCDIYTSISKSVCLNLPNLKIHLHLNIIYFVNYLFSFRYNVEFIEHTYLYHLKRTDIKHNFSPYFYVLYLTSKTSWSQTIGVIAFLPQAISVIAVGVKYHMKPSVACFFQTFAFVTFNKVCTSQV